MTKREIKRVIALARKMFLTGLTKKQQKAVESLWKSPK